MSVIELRCSTINCNNHHQSGVNIQIPYPINIPVSTLVQLQCLFGDLTVSKLAQGMFFSSTTYRPTDSGTHTAPYKSGKGPLSSEGSTTVCSAYLHLVTKQRIRETPYFRPLPTSSWCQRVSSLFLTRDKLRTFRQCEIFQQPKTSVTLLRSSITPSLKLDSKI